MESNYRSGQPNDAPGLTAKSTEAAKHHSKKAAEIAKEQLTDTAVLAREAAYSGAWVWPIQVSLDRAWRKFRARR
jgi:hypothetical protein